MRTYELVVVIKPIAEKERKRVMDGVKALLKGMKVVSEEAWGSKALKYKIKGEQTGFYFLLTLEGDLVPADLGKKLYNTEEVLRHLVIRRV